MKQREGVKTNKKQRLSILVNKASRVLSSLHPGKSRSGMDKIIDYSMSIEALA